MHFKSFACSFDDYMLLANLIFLCLLSPSLILTQHRMQHLQWQQFQLQQMQAQHQQQAAQQQQQQGGGAPSGGGGGMPPSPANPAQAQGGQQQQAAAPGTERTV